MKYLTKTIVLATGLIASSVYAESHTHTIQVAQAKETLKHDWWWFFFL